MSLETRLTALATRVATECKSLWTAVNGKAATVHGHVLTDANVTGTLAIAKGGTGQTYASGARNALGAPGVYSTWFATITAGTWNTVTHDLSTAYVTVQFLAGSPWLPYELEWEPVAGDDSIRFRADVALDDVGVLVVGF